MAGVGAAGTAAAKAPKPAKKAAFTMKCDCAKVAPGALLTTLAGGYGDTYTLKPQTKIDQAGHGTGGYSHCDFSQSAGYPWGAKAEGPGEVTILYGAGAVSFYKRDHAGAGLPPDRLVQPRRMRTVSRKWCRQTC